MKELKRWRLGSQVSRRPGHAKDGLGACVTTCRSLIKATTRQRVGNLGEEGLLVRLPAPQGVAAHGAGVEVDFTPNEPEGPRRVDVEGPAGEMDRATFRGAAQVDQHSTRRCLQVEGPHW
jgi:hypothetical protein